MEHISGSILVADDDAVIRRILSLFLETAGHKVQTAVNGEQALAMMKANDFDLVMLDVVMPIMDGYDVLAAMMQDEELKHVPAIVVSASSQDESAIRCIELGAVDYVSKPFNSVLLHARVQSSLRHKRYRDQERAHLQNLEAMYAEVQAANEAKSEFVAVVAHELRSPMTTLGVYKYLMKNAKNSTPEQQKLLTKMEVSLERMRDLVADLDRVTRLESGDFKLDCGPVSLMDVVQTTVEGLVHQIEDRQHKVRIDVPAALAPVWADRARLIQILTNLVGNAVKYTPQRGRLRVTAVADPHDPNFTRISVQDDGFGIRPEEQSSIFGKFFRSEAGEIRAQEGTGLGLHITQQLVERHGGQIWFESVEGKGTTFHFTLPLTNTMEWPKPGQHAKVSPTTAAAQPSAKAA